MKVLQEPEWRHRKAEWTEQERRQLATLTTLAKVNTILLAAIFLLLFLFLCFEIMR